MISRRDLAIGLLGACGLQAQTRQEKGEALVRSAFSTIGGEDFLAIQTQVRAGRAYSFYNRQVRGRRASRSTIAMSGCRPMRGRTGCP